MKAVVAHAYGPPESLCLQDWPVVPPGPGEVQVRLHAAGVSFVDVLVAAGKHQSRPVLPFVPGSEFSGIIVAVGPQVDGLRCGDAVCGGKTSGILAQLVTLPASRVQRLPPGVDMNQAAILRANYLTAWYALIERGRLAAGDTLLVLGAAGGTGIAACQLGRHLGATVIASASSPAKREFALDHGATHAIDAAAPDWRAQLRTLTDGRGVDVVFDPVGGAATEPAFRSLAYKGRHLVVGFAAGSIPSLPVNLALLKGASLVGVLTSYFTDRAPAAADAARARILQLFVDGALSPPVGRVYALADYVAALQDAAAGAQPGRVLLRMDDATGGLGDCLTVPASASDGG